MEEEPWPAHWTPCGDPDDEPDWETDGLHTPTPCPFCDYAGPSPIKRSWLGGEVIAFEPLNPVTEGHLLVVPRRHVKHLGEDPELSAIVMKCAAMCVAVELNPAAHTVYRTDLGCNVITSAGRSATQTVEHLHVHIIPRRDLDGLSLPWTHITQDGES